MSILKYCGGWAKSPATPGKPMWRSSNCFCFPPTLSIGSKRLCLPKDYWMATLDTIRTDFLVLPAKLTKHGSQNVLLLPKDYHYRKEFQEALRRIQKLRLPVIFVFASNFSTGIVGNSVKNRGFHAFLRINDCISILFLTFPNQHPPSS